MRVTKGTTMNMARIVEKVMSRYIKDPSRRAYDGVVCCYDNGKDQCAIGQLLTPSDRKLNEGLDVLELNLKYGIKLGNHRVKHPSYEVTRILKMMQRLHDGPRNWCDTGLTDLGKEKYKFLIYEASKVTV